MHCPFCRHPDSKVVDSRTTDDGAAIRRRRQCGSCGRRFSTLETTTIAVIKRSGVTEPFERSKIVSGVRKACQGRPVTEDDLAKLAQEVEEAVRSQGIAEIEAHEVGLAILQPLRRLDVVAYLRFASVYQAFNDLNDFEAAIDVLRQEQQVQAAGQQALVEEGGHAPRRSKRAAANTQAKTQTRGGKARESASAETQPAQERLL
ncbi:transcriptional repressor NrdR [Kocuria subflava]|uniref:Transcriptional repressor NrdR n=1 Tax=Kocuria subflava TaxID=1736139 RepID=A0A846U5B8_9MICC|nr:MULTISPECIES: transcriptional regulator NrdR [unclassified Kocuria]NKE08896.1 transcriptional repressor NrdR [Kocuria subflava]